MDIRIITSSDFRKNQKKYLDLSKKERIVITQRGTNEVIELVRKDKIEVSNLHRAITKDELMEGIEADIRKMYNK
ncbi:hypothetical protein M2451_002959 [Dysgonomonas sp. PFB1-18]|uniref:hypothetical protein n=1 Tax=unclassified Dysgonomonas TaxID=2630389 RepID=UPI0013D2DD89|nr:MULTISPECIES: hypothetical protein [unclassified Dysgonomonas]MDH6310069.1 hypothetical protein [Dysgonomonas sp. PF1-14]MDH6339978.1 hypothetical protein [Dysgonomonas sp. PF1-16]MDH6381626.1 hypothetical protein [Dysgonomonas sp. PFB1-18]MDH6398736.1 hypothetical protein [Dysgonomonas sp. PF1-23]NDV93583.1 hypothetical protein [Dysgonomonas sp. 521]